MITIQKSGRKFTLHSKKVEDLCKKYGKEETYRRLAEAIRADRKNGGKT